MKSDADWVLLEDIGEVGQRDIFKVARTPIGFLAEIEKCKKNLEMLYVQCRNSDGAGVQSLPLSNTIIARYFKFKKAATDTEIEQDIAEIMNTYPEEFLALLSGDEMTIWKSVFKKYHRINRLFSPSLK